MRTRQLGSLGFCRFYARPGFGRGKVCFNLFDLQDFINADEDTSEKRKGMSAGRSLEFRRMKIM